MPLAETLRFILSHPLNRGRPLAALARFAGWQVASRMRTEIDFRWLDGSKLRLRRGMTGGTGNVYCGLHEFVEMAFLLHLLRPGDLFLDVGANIGSYTVLASRVCGARTIAFEPADESAAVLEENVRVNAIDPLVRVCRLALGERAGEVAFTCGLDTVNRVATEADRSTRRVRGARLDEAAAGLAPTAIKLDVEGYEERVLAGSTGILGCASLLAIQSELDSERVGALLAGFGFHPVFYDPFARALSSTPFGYAVSNMLYVRDRDETAARLANAPRRRVAGRWL